MTYEGAIERLRRLHCWGIGMECEYHMDKRGKCYSCEISIAVESIERRIPKKPLESDGYSRKAGWMYKCPTCLRCEYVEKRSMLDTHCGFCGQAIDWNDTQE